MQLRILTIITISLSIELYGQNEQNELPDNYLPITFKIQKGILVGECEYLEGFSFSMDLQVDSLEKIPKKAELIKIIRSKEITGILTYPNNSETEIIYEIVNHRGIEDVYMKTSLGYFLWEMLKIKSQELSFAIYWWYCPPATNIDLDILNLADSLLTDPSNWHQNDDRKCEDDIANNIWSLFCALKYASIEKMGEYNHHNTAMQTVRFIIDEIIPGHQFEHTLMDYNNAPSTTHKDVLNILNLAKEKIRQKLNATNK